MRRNHRLCSGPNAAGSSVKIVADGIVVGLMRRWMTTCTPAIAGCRAIRRCASASPFGWYCFGSSPAGADLAMTMRA